MARAPAVHVRPDRFTESPAIVLIPGHRVGLAAVSYRISNGTDYDQHVFLKLRPLVAARFYTNTLLSFSAYTRNGGVTVRCH